MKVYRNRSRIQRLPDPGTVWEWEDARAVAGNSVLQVLEAADLVERVEGRWWRCTGELAAYLEDVHGVELAGSIGQETLPVDVRPVIDRADTCGDSLQSTASPFGDARQVTLDGDAADPGLVDDVRWPLDQLKRNGRKHPAEWSGQEQLRECFTRVAG